MLVQRSFWVRRPNDFRYPVTAAPPACAFRSVSRYAGPLISWKHHSEYAIVPSANEVASGVSILKYAVVDRGMRAATVKAVFPLVVLSGIVVLLTGCSPAQDRGSVAFAAEEWAKSGNYIVSYGPVLEPFGNDSSNSYYLHAPTGDEIDHLRGSGSWTPVALPTHGGSYLYFADSIQQYGLHDGSVDLHRYDPITYFGFSPEGSMAVAIVNTSQSESFAHQAHILREDGTTSTHDLPLAPHSLAVGDKHAIIIGYTPNGTASDRRMFLLDSDGEGREIAFPDGYEVNSPDFKYPHVNYLGDGSFEILQGRVEGNRTFLTAFEVRVGDDNKLDSQQVTEHVMTLNDDFAVTRTLQGGRNGFIDNEGRVFVNKKDSEDPQLTGVIEGFSEDQFILVNSASEDPKFGLEREGKVEIRSWNSPEKPLVTLKPHIEACSDSSCGISSISEIS